jgi:NTE family protein
MRSKLDTSRGFLAMLRDLGREKAREWLEHHFDRVGSGSTLDLASWTPVERDGSKPS